MRSLNSRGFLGNRTATTGLFAVAVVSFAAMLSGAISPYSPIAMDLGHRFAAPDLSHPLGTDQFGRDIFSRVLDGARASLTIAVSAVATAMVLGSTLALVTGYVGGVIDLVFTRLVDVLLAIPPLLIALGIVAVAGPSGLSVAVAIAIAYTPTFARVIRDAVVSTRVRTYVEASRGMGASIPRVLIGDILPNVLPTIVVLATSAVAWAILDEANLGFLGVGVQPPNPSWGSMLIEGRQYIFQGPWIAIGAGLAVTIAVFGFNLLGDGLRDLLDPRAWQRET